MGQQRPSEPPADEPDDYDLWLEVLMQEPEFREAYAAAERRAEMNYRADFPPPPPTFRQFLWRERWVFAVAALILLTVSLGSSWLMVQLNAPYYARFLVGGAVGFLLYRVLSSVLARRLQRHQ